MNTCSRGSKPYIAPAQVRCESWHPEFPDRYQCQRETHLDGQHVWRSTYSASGRLVLKWRDKEAA